MDHEGLIHKQFDIAGIGLDCVDVGSLHVMNACAPGYDFFNRLGNTITMKSLQIKVILDPTFNVLVGGTSELGTMILVYDKSYNGVNPAWSDVMATTDGSGFTQSNAFSFPNQKNKERFEIIRQWDWYMSDNATSVLSNLQWHGSEKMHFWEETIDLEDRVTKYSAALFAPSSIATGALILMCMGTSASTVNTYNFVIQARLKFVD